MLLIRQRSLACVFLDLPWATSGLTCSTFGRTAAAVRVEYGDVVSDGMGGPSQCAREMDYASSSLPADGDVSADGSKLKVD